MDGLTPRRCEIYAATLPTREGKARKLVVIVSRDAINAGMHVIGARVTSTERPRFLPSVVQLDPDRESGLTVRSFVLCHDLLAIDRAALDPRPTGVVPLGKMIEIERCLLYALDLESYVRS